MKRATRLVLSEVKFGLRLTEDEAADILASDAKQRAEIRDLKARLKSVKPAISERELALVAALTETQSLLVAASIEPRAREEFHAQIDENRAALAAYAELKL